MFSGHKDEAVKTYRGFGSKEILEEINRILGSPKWPMVMGKESFVDWVKNTFFSKKRHIEVPESKTLAPDVKKIKSEVCRLYDVNEEDLLISKRGTTNEPRNVAIYLTKKLTGKTLREIGREFGINNYSSVSTIIERTRKKAGAERAFREGIDKLKMDLKVSQEQTCPLF